MERPLTIIAEQGSTLAELGWTPFFSDQISSEEEEHCRPVRVMAVHRGKIAVAGAGADLLISPHISDAASTEEHPTVGDWLLVDQETLQPLRVMRRANLFKRGAAGHGRGVQLIAANVDTLFIVASCNQDFNVARLERYLVLAREVDVDPVIVLTKADLTDTPHVFADAARRLQPDLLVEVVNARDAQSIAGLARWCGVGKTVALLGSSGVGKSTLVNTLIGSQNIATQAVREDDGKGRHTTTVREMHRLDQGGWLIDTPGMRELQLSDVAAGISEVFDDIELLALRCRFTNCGHEVEPGCAIRAAIADGSLTVERLERQRKLAAENSTNTEISDWRKARDESARR